MDDQFSLADGAFSANEDHGELLIEFQKHADHTKLKQVKFLSGSTDGKNVEMIRGRRVNAKDHKMGWYKQAFTFEDLRENKDHATLFVLEINRRSRVPLKSLSGPFASVKQDTKTLWTFELLPKHEARTRLCVANNDGSRVYVTQFEPIQPQSGIPELRIVKDRDREHAKEPITANADFYARGVFEPTRTQIGTVFTVLDRANMYTIAYSGVTSERGGSGHVPLLAALSADDCVVM
ncbi:MAG: hypothetical protein Q9162_006308 [Coniocarpon cinnabarinum]